MIDFVYQNKNAGNVFQRKLCFNHCLFFSFFFPQMTDNGISLPDHVTCSIQWADAVVLVYSVTDRSSFDLIDQLHQRVVRSSGASMPPLILLANKADLLHLRRVDSQQGPILAGNLGCSFYEVSASEDYNQVHGAFHRLCCQLAKQPPPASSSPPTSASGVTEKRRSLLIPRPKSPNMQDLKRRFKQALSAKVRTVTSVWGALQAESGWEWPQKVLNVGKEDGRFTLLQWSPAPVQLVWYEQYSRRQMNLCRDKWRLGEMESVLSDDAKSSGEAVQGEKISLWGQKQPIEAERTKNCI